MKMPMPWQIKKKLMTKSILSHVPSSNNSSLILFCEVIMANKYLNKNGGNVMPLQYIAPITKLYQINVLLQANSYFVMAYSIPRKVSHTQENKHTKLSVDHCLNTLTIPNMWLWIQTSHQTSIIDVHSSMN